MWLCRTLLTAALVVLLVSTGTVAGGASAQPERSSGETPLPADSIVVEVDVHQDGSATFKVQYEYHLDGPNRTRAFQHLQRQIERSEGYNRQVRQDFHGTVDVAENKTDREMAARNVSIYARPHPFVEDYARVVHSFTWEGFADVNGERVRIGEALSGFWLPPHGELVLRLPPGYEVAGVTPSPDDRDGRELTWGAPEFDPREPRVTLERSRDARDVALSGLALATLLGGLLVLRRYRGALVTGLERVPVLRALAPSRASESPPGAENGDAGSTPEESHGTVPPDDGDEPDDAHAVGFEDEPADVGADSGAGDGSAPAVHDAPPLTNEEQLRQVLDEHDGRVKQQQVAEATGWSDSKTSRVVRSLEQDGAVDVYRIGRENVVCYPEVDAVNV